MTSERLELRGEILDGKYRVGPRLGLGGTGVVFEGERITDGHAIVIKTLRPCFVEHPDLGRRLRREAEVAREVAHPAVVPVLDEGTLTDGSPYLVMERAHGESVQRLLSRVGTLGAQETALLIARVCSVLHAAHQSGYIHRDLKPEHILLDPTDDGSVRITLLDFGVCAAPTAPQEEKLREHGRVFGTPSYVSPEQASGKPDVDARADVFGLGVCMYEMLTGHLPFRASNVAKLLIRIIKEDAPPLAAVAPHIDTNLQKIVMMALARDPDHRWPSARALSRALLSCVTDRVAVERHLASIVLPDLATGEPNIPTMRDTSLSTAAAA